VRRVGPLLGGIGLLLAIAALHFWDLGTAPLYSVGEPREAMQVVDEIDRGEWILPLRNGTELPSKPPLYHWLAAVVALVAGRIDEWVVRLPSALMATAAVLAVAWFGARRWDAAAGITAGCMLTANFEWLHVARAARVDMTLTACLTAAFLALATIVEAPAPPPVALAIFYGAMALAFLAKGPVGIALPVLTAVAYLAVRRDVGRVRRMHVVRGMTVAIGIPAVWYLLAIAVGGMPFVHKQILRENILHFLGPGTHGTSESHPFWYYGTTFLGGFAPWCLFVAPLAVYLWQHRRDRAVWEPYVYPAVWFAVVVGFYTMSRSKRSGYILAAYPAAALMLGGWWSAVIRAEQTVPTALRRILSALVMAVAAVTAALVLMLALHAIGLHPLEWIRPLLHRRDQQNLPIVADVLRTHPIAIGAWAACIVAGAGLLVYAARRGQWAIAFAALLLYVGSTAAAIDHTLLPRLADDRSYRPFVAEVMQVSGGENLFFLDAFDYGTVFYARRHIPVVRAPLPPAPAWIIAAEPAYARLPEQERARTAVVAQSAATGSDISERLLLLRVQ
jgi:4-amino-4-deoxy-L-arabinose transferase-like glycosyltransferase